MDSATKDTLAQLDNLLAASNQSWLFGAGISLDAGIPLMWPAAQTAIHRIAREGRKYGIGLMLVSQRPADVESTVISQCGTWIVLRFTNAADQQHVSRFLPDGLSGMTKTLPSLAQQEAIFVGEGAAMPSRVRIRDLAENELPKSETAKFAKGWILDRLTEAEIAAGANRMAG